ncbi:hypothetical protein PVT67_13185 [Gallaecimonas kandeliae]|uniref:hypothetical protein n=1 Tax=Gallaecimonas kandeliae TaxID=3029055 RepID=UPI00264A15AD|nr:hypothetical protein [Gallaecimonas kandeliae]WKE64616.1 hypothetical protein PVT67_13185 [Gallaecimonas kandeliae]
MKSKLKLFFLALGLGTVFMLLAAVAYWLCLDAADDNSEMFASGRRLIIHSSSSGYLPGVVMGLVIFGLFFLSVIAFLPLDEKARKRKGMKLQKAVAVGAIASLVLTFAGPFWFSHNWEAKAEALGYQPCPPLTLLINRMTYQAWTKNLDLCFDPEVSRLVQRGGPEESKAVEAMLAQRRRP